MGSLLDHYPHRLSAVGRFARELHIGDEREQRANPLTDERVVIREHDADHDAASLVGSHALTANALPGALTPMDKRPPSSSSRARIPAKP